VVRDRFHRPFELLARGRKPRNDRGHQHACVDAGIHELADGAQPLKGVRGARLEDPPGLVVDGRHAHAHPGAGRPGHVHQHIAVADDHRTLRDQADGRSSARQCLEAAASEPVMAFDRLVRIGRRAKGDELARPRRPIELPAQHVHHVALDENDRRELVVGVHLELHVIPAREAVMATVGAAAVRVECPVERHPAHGIERGPAGHLLISRLVGTPVGFGERGGAAAFDDVRDVPGAQVFGSEINEQRIGRGKRGVPGHGQFSLFLRPSS
jgi:hypothetical protein